MSANCDHIQEDAVTASVDAGSAIAVADTQSTEGLSAEARWQLIATVAYRRYERRAGAPGDAVSDWLEAEKEIDRLLRGRALAAEEGDDSMKGTFIRRLAVVVAESEARLNELTNRAKTANETLRRKFEERRKMVVSRCDAVHGKLVEIREHTDEAWAHLRQGAERAAREMSTAVRELGSLFK